uniref:Sugar phosphate transporter domain-containing protein n=2 Tax=Phaeomonas parva TaxID=124430 RepID=A0A7S1XM77_9STRA|mmetsp:Transcript_16059/g.49058  ORF Transcript_16059/g.49058 Transcript_16059/m.49058 type:complete len:439 (+) Transcript_16059:205-1521(+)
MGIQGAAKMQQRGSLWVLGAATLAWYTVSISITFANKWLLSSRDFHVPCFMTLVHNASMAVVTLALSRVPGFEVTPISRRQFLGGIVPIAFCTALDVAASNAALDHLTVSVYTMLKGTVPAFTLFFALLFRLEKPNTLLICSIVVVVLGVMMCAAGDDDSGRPNSLTGILLILGACAASGFRWALSQLLMKDPPAEAAGGDEGQPNGKGRKLDRDLEMAAFNEELSVLEEYGLEEEEDAEDEGHIAPGAGVMRPNSLKPMLQMVHSSPFKGDTGGTDHEDHHQSPISMITRVAPTTACFLVPVVLIFETQKLRDMEMSADDWGVTMGCIGAVSLLVFMLLVSEYCLVNLASSLSLSVLGILKELVTIVLAVMIFHDVLTTTNVIGFCVATLGIMTYVSVLSFNHPFPSRSAHPHAGAPDANPDTKPVELSQAREAVEP